MLCGDWCVEEVVAHLTAAGSKNQWRWLRSMLGARLNMHLHNQRRIEDHRRGQLDLKTVGTGQNHSAKHELQVARRPPFESGEDRYRVADLFAGCGGLSLGIAQACRLHNIGLDIALAVDFEASATIAYRANFPMARNLTTTSVESLFDGELGAKPTELERLTQSGVGPIHALVGGPPCQGHSNLNNHTRRIDPKNDLYLYMVRAAEILAPEVVLVENVPAVLNDRHSGENVVQRARYGFRAAGYSVADEVVSLYDLGVAQTRKRHILIASSRKGIDPAGVLKEIGESRQHRDLRWAIGDLPDTHNSPLDTPPKASDTNLKRMQYLLDNNLFDLPNSERPTCHQGSHSYKSMYGRLKWDEPAQTITSGFSSIGQGRYMHPERKRALTAHEAARIQGFPDYFKFEIGLTRSALATMIANAVPPQLARSVFSHVLGLRTSSEEMVDLLPSKAA